MTVIRTFVDTGILIAAARGVGDEATSALEIRKDTRGRSFGRPFCGACRSRLCLAVLELVLDW